MPDYYAQRLANLEAVVFAGIGSPAQAQVISTPGAGEIVVQNGGLILIVAPDSVSLSLAPPTPAQTGYTISILNANGFFNSVIGAFISVGTPVEEYGSLVDSGAIGNICKLVAVGGTWQFASGFGWGGVS